MPVGMAEFQEVPFGLVLLADRWGAGAMLATVCWVVPTGCVVVELPVVVMAVV
jgi:hypothetical protein